MISSGTVVVFDVQVSIDIGSFPSTDDLLFFSNGYSPTRPIRINDWIIKFASTIFIIFTP